MVKVGSENIENTVQKFNIIREPKRWVADVKF
jgi:hypothetical protein